MNYEVVISDKCDIDPKIVLAACPATPESEEQIVKTLALSGIRASVEKSVDDKIKYRIFVKNNNFFHRKNNENPLNLEKDLLDQLKKNPFYVHMAEDLFANRLDNMNEMKMKLRLEQSMDLKENNLNKLGWKKEYIKKILFSPTYLKYEYLLSNIGERISNNIFAKIVEIVLGQLPNCFVNLQDRDRRSLKDYLALYGLKGPINTVLLMNRKNNSSSEEKIDSLLTIIYVMNMKKSDLSNIVLNANFLTDEQIQKIKNELKSSLKQSQNFNTINSVLSKYNIFCSSFEVKDIPGKKYDLVLGCIPKTNNTKQIINLINFNGFKADHALLLLMASLCGLKIGSAFNEMSLQNYLNLINTYLGQIPGYNIESNNGITIHLHFKEEPTIKWPKPIVSYGGANKLLKLNPFELQFFSNLWSFILKFSFAFDRLPWNLKFFKTAEFCTGLNIKNVNEFGSIEAVLNFFLSYDFIINALSRALQTYYPSFDINFKTHVLNIKYFKIIFEFLNKLFLYNYINKNETDNSITNKLAMGFLFAPEIIFPYFDSYYNSYEKIRNFSINPNIFILGLNKENIIFRPEFQYILLNHDKYEHRKTDIRLAATGLFGSNILEKLDLLPHEVAIKSTFFRIPLSSQPLNENILYMIGVRHLMLTEIWNSFYIIGSSIMVLWGGMNMGISCWAKKLDEMFISVVFGLIFLAEILSTIGFFVGLGIEIVYDSKNNSFEFKLFNFKDSYGTLNIGYQNASHQPKVVLF